MILQTGHYVNKDNGGPRASGDDPDTRQNAAEPEPWTPRERG